MELNFTTQKVFHWYNIQDFILQLQHSENIFVPAKYLTLNMTLTFTKFVTIYTPVVES